MGSAKGRQVRGNAARAIVLLVCLMVLVAHASAANVVVGGKSGWTLGYKYTNWVKTAKVKPGDYLVFNYAKAIHDVVQVSASNYKSCTKKGSTYSRTGSTRVRIPKAGTYYFICSIAAHCAQGMKVAVTAK